MKLKKSVLGLVLIMLMALPAAAQQVSDSAIRAMVSLYKSQNYTGCLQASENIIKKNPSNVYAQYYKALSYTRLGKKDDAMTAYDKVINLNTNQTLSKYAERGKACLESPEECSKYAEDADELDKFIKSNKFYDKSVQSEVNKKKLDRIRENINDEIGTGNKKKSEMPTNDEIANAVKTLAKVGFNPMTGLQGASVQNPEMTQMNMLLGNNEYQSNGMNNMLPFLLMSQNQNGKNNIPPELIQSMMMSQMQMY